MRVQSSYSFFTLNLLDLFLSCGVTLVRWAEDTSTLSIALSNQEGDFNHLWQWWGLNVGLLPSADCSNLQAIVTTALKQRVISALFCRE